MPSRASTSLLHYRITVRDDKSLSMCQCPHGLVPHCYGRRSYYEIIWRKSVSMPSRAYTSLLLEKTGFLGGKTLQVSMPSRAYTSLLPHITRMSLISTNQCQCPLGLIPHCYGLDGEGAMFAFNGRVNALTGLYLIATFVPTLATKER